MNGWKGRWALNKLLQLLGLARRGGRVVVGMDAVRGSLFEHRARLVLLAADAAARSEKEIRFAAEKAHAEKGGRIPPIVRISIDMDTLGAALGLQKPVGAVGVTDEGFAKAMLARLTENERPAADGACID